MNRNIGITTFQPTWSEADECFIFKWTTTGLVDLAPVLVVDFGILKNANCYKEEIYYIMEKVRRLKCDCMWVNPCYKDVARIFKEI